MKTDLLACRHIGVNKADAEVMLRKIGVGSLDELIDKTIPANIRLKEPLALPPATLAIPPSWKPEAWRPVMLARPEIWKPVISFCTTLDTALIPIPFS